ncbi:MAG: CAP domain-containing protein [Clostridia bacterium]|nr:CAP domain-containing protein [Clostridia bacterium]
MKKIKIIICSMLFLLILGIMSTSTAMTHYQTVGTATGLVTATTLNVRQGPGAKFNIITRVYKNQYIRIFAKIGDWYVIQTDNDYLGAVSSKYIKLIYPKTSTNQNTSGGDSATTSQLTADEQEVFDLINAKRVANGLAALKIDDELQNVARIKAQDMVNNNYFSHTSPVYGSPFDMIKKFGISYKTAGENIAGNSTNSGAVNAWMNSSGHKANILNTSFNYTGIGVVKSPTYGKIYVQMFMGK